MSQLFGFAGSDDFYSSNPKDQSLFLPLGHHVDLYYPSRKRSRVTVPFLFKFEQKKQASIDVLPDECLFEVFRRLEGLERSASACVSKRWLGLLSSIRKEELAVPQAEVVSESADGGYLSRSLEGKKATDVKLSAIAVGTTTRGGLGKLSVRGGGCKVTNSGLRAVGRCCGSLKVLSLWNLTSVSDEGLTEIGEGCGQLEKLDLCQCPGITDKGLKAIARNCPNLTDLTIESCVNIGNEGLQAIGQSCVNLKSVSIKNCPAVGDQGISGLVSSASSYSLMKVKLQALNITDMSLAVIGHYGKAVTDLVLSVLPNVTERGFWVMGNGHGLQKLKSFSVTSCIGATDAGLEAVAKGCPNLKQFCLRKCAFLSDNGLVAFVKNSATLESMQLEECHRITQFGFFGSLLNCGTKLKAFSLVSCLGIKDLDAGVSVPSPCESLRSLSIHNCPGFGDGSLSFLGKLCPQLQNLELTGLQGVTDSGLLELLVSCKSGLVKVNLSGCVNLSDRIVMEMSEHHGWTLEKLNLEGCIKITDASLSAIAKGCLLLSDLDVSRCSITDAGIASLASSGLLGLQVFSISGCHMVSDKSFQNLMLLGQTLLGLSLQHCNAISSSTVELLVERLWRCDVLC